MSEFAPHNDPHPDAMEAKDLWLLLPAMTVAGLVGLTVFFLYF
ncbi:MAG TPA: hypothetical protein PKW95_08700 [bacterium]|nr:hypothetical protein [bacterium]